MLSFWANGADERLKQLRLERRDRLRSLRIQWLAACDRKQRAALTEKIRALKQHYGEAIRQVRYALHVST